MNLKKKYYKMLDNFYCRSNKAKFNVTPLKRKACKKSVPNLLKLCASCFNKAYPFTQTEGIIKFLMCNTLRKVWRSPRISMEIMVMEKGFPNRSLLESSPVKQEIEMW